MKTITLNLLAEDQRAEQAAARDPIKGAAALGILLVLLAVGTGACFSIQTGQAAATIDGLEQLWNKVSAGAGAGLTAEVHAKRAFAQDLLEIHRARTLFAPQLALVKDVIPETVQLTRFGFTISVEASAPTAVVDPTEVLGKKDKEAPPPGPARAARPKVVERLRLLLDGRATCSRPELEVDDFLKALKAAPEIQEQMQQIQLMSISRLASAANALPSVAFVIECQYKESK